MGTHGQGGGTAEGGEVEGGKGRGIDCVSRGMRCGGSILLSLLAFAAPAPAVDESKPPAARTESFDKDPGWEELNNRTPSTSANMVRQDFGYSASSFATDSKGEIGGTLWRADWVWGRMRKNLVTAGRHDIIDLMVCDPSLPNSDARPGRGPRAGNESDFLAIFPSLKQDRCGGLKWWQWTPWSADENSSQYDRSASMS